MVEAGTPGSGARRNWKLLDAPVGPSSILELVHAGDLSPVFFGLGDDQLRRAALPDASLELAQRPVARHSQGGPVDPLRPRVQRLCVQAPGQHGSAATPATDRLRAGSLLPATSPQDMNRAPCPAPAARIRLSRPQKLFGQDRRRLVEDAYLPATVIGPEQPPASFAIATLSNVGQKVGVRRHSLLSSPEDFSWLAHPKPSAFKGLPQGG